MFCATFCATLWHKYTLVKVWHRGDTCVSKDTHSDTFLQRRHICLQGDTFRQIQTEETLGTSVKVGTNRYILEKVGTLNGVIRARLTDWGKCGKLGNWGNWSNWGKWGNWGKLR